MKNIGFLLLIFTAFLIFSCKGSKNTTDDADQMPSPSKSEQEAYQLKEGPGKLLAEMKKSACFGKCPVYNFRVFDNGRLEYQGLIHTERLGLYSRMISADSFYHFAKTLAEADLWQYEDFYSSGATDFPMTTITYFQKDTSKTVAGDFERPAAVQVLEKQLIQMADAGDWVQEEMLVPPGTIEGEIIVELSPAFRPEKLESDFSGEGLKLKERVAPNLNLWVFLFDPEKIKPGRMAVLLKNNEAVESVDFNKKLNTRN